MKIRRLGWAGLEICASDTNLVIDYMLDPGIFKAMFGPDADQLVKVALRSQRAALLTHLHWDHADVDAVKDALADDGIVLRPHRKPVESEIEKAATGDVETRLQASSLETQSFAPGEKVEVGPFAITALFATDGLGSPQVSWLVEADGKRLLHAGDTLWHGAWWDVRQLHGHIDVACLPGNGVEVSFPQWQPPVEVPADLTPEQAVEAARALRADLLVPIHFNATFEHPNFYRPTANAQQRIESAAARKQQAVAFLKPGEWRDV